jgi:hypothetical protein
MDVDAASGTSIHNVEEGIEWWATQSMPLMIDLLLDSDETPSTTLPSDISVGDRAVVSYGMVSCTSILLSAICYQVFYSFAYD